MMDSSSDSLRSRITSEPEASGRNARLALRLRETRRAMGYTQATLGARAGLAPAAISHFENGGRRPSATNLERLANALSVSVDYLMGRDLGEQSERPQFQAVFRQMAEMSDEALIDLRKYSERLAELDRMKREAIDPQDR